MYRLVLIVIFSLSFSLFSFSQRRTESSQNKENSTVKYLEINGGIFYDDRGRNYLGPNIFSIQLLKEKGDIQRGYGLTMSRIVVGDPITSGPDTTGGLEFTSNEIQLIYFLGKNLFVSKKVKIIGALTSSLLWNNVKTNPYLSVNYPSKTNSYLLGLGLEPIIRFQVTNKITFNTSLRINLIHIGYKHFRFENPFLPIRQQVTRDFVSDFFRKTAYLKLGVGLKL